jgi:MFS family permease
MDTITEKMDTTHSETSTSIASNDKGSDDKLHMPSVKDEETAVTSSPAPQMTFKRLMALLSLTGLFITAAVPSFLITAALCNPSSLHYLIIAYVVADIGGESSFAWVGMANTLSTAAVSPFVGAISDLLGHRYVGLLGSVIVMMGLITIGVSQTIEVCIGGSALLGVGAALAEIVGTVGILEMAPVKNRGYYLACAFIFLLPWAPSQTYGTTPRSFCTEQLNYTLQLVLGDGVRGLAQFWRGGIQFYFSSFIGLRHGPIHLD